MHKRASHRKPKQRKAKQHRRDRNPQAVHAPITAIVKNRERSLKPDEIDLLKKTVAKGTDDQEFALFMLICRKHKLDPFTRQVYAIIWPTNNGQSHEMVIITGINGYRAMAARSHADFAGSSAATFVMSKDKTPAGRSIPESATVDVYRRNGPTSTCTVYWEEFAPPDLHNKRADFWNRLPKHMLSKCAESQALRKAFPDLSDIYTEEEVSQRLADLTPEGREIHTDGVAPSGHIVDSHAVAKAEQKQILDDKLAHGHPAGSEKAKQADQALRRVEEEDARLAAAKNVTPGSGKQEATPETKSKPVAAASGVRALPDGCTLLSGTIHRVVNSTTKAKNPVVNLKLNQVWYAIYSKTLCALFPYEDPKLIGNVVEAWLDEKKQIVGFKRIGNMRFKEDGRTPIPRQPGEEG